MAAKFSNLLEKQLPRYQPEEGDTIDIVAFKYVLPSVNLSFWESSLLGCGVGGRHVAVKRKPLKGRLKYGKPGSYRVVILVDSLRDWLTEYNPDNTQTVDEIIEQLQKVSDKHDRYLANLKKQAMLKNGTSWGKQPGIAPKEKAKPTLVFDTKSISEVIS
jgi:hypothetical protein